VYYPGILESFQPPMLQKGYAKPELCRRVTDRVSVLFRTDLADKPPLNLVCGG